MRGSDLLSYAGPAFDVTRGHPLPLGATPLHDGVNFAIYSNQPALSLVLFAPSSDTVLAEWPLDPRYNRTGLVWHADLCDLDRRVEYAYRAGDGPLLVDPYARSIERSPSGALHGRIVDATFDWRSDQPLDRPLADSVIYELHVRGFTRHPSSRVRAPGTYLGLVEKIPYLRDLGVTAVELLPINEFDETNPRRNPLTGEPLTNYWGYSSIGFFAPHEPFAATEGRALEELKTLVRELHAAGIEVILDMVFNHTSEGGADGPTHSFRGLALDTYYLFEPDGRYANYTGCGNTVNCNHPVVRDLVLDCLRYWVSEVHIDGFRFDLASVLGRGRDGSVLANPPLIERIAEDPVLAGTKLIAEAWDAAGLYQVGSFPHWGRWAEWNGRYRDDARRILKSDGGCLRSLGARLLGSPDIYDGGDRAPSHSVNFVTCHDGFTLDDLVSYDRKHNEENGENQADGNDANLSWNCGAEGPTDDPEVNRLRARQRKDAFALLLLSQGVPMILAGDEVGRTQRGNNNAYCQDSEISWLDWRDLERNAELHRFVRGLIHLRHRHDILRQRTFLAGPGAPLPRHRFFGPDGDPDWSWDSRSLLLLLEARAPGSDLAILVHAHWEPRRFTLPGGRRWRRVVDTFAAAPDDLVDEETAPEAGPTHVAGPRSVALFITSR